MGGLSGDPIELILSKLRKKKRAGKGWVALCPAHEDKQFSLSVGRGQDGRALLKCHAGCSIDSICEAFGISKTDLFANSGQGRPQNSDWDIVARYDYHDEAGSLVCEHVRYRNKQFTWRAPDGQGGWRYGLYAAWFEQWSDGDWRAVKDKDKNIFDDPDHRPHANARWFGEVKRCSLYKEERLRDALPGSLVLYVEGEKDQHTATRLDFIATTAGGASDWRAGFARCFSEMNLVIIPDNDSAGERLASKVAADCYGEAESIRVLRLPDLPEHGDLSDWLESQSAEGLTLDQARARLLALIEDAELWQPEAGQDEVIERAKQEAMRAVERTVAGMRQADSDPLISEDKHKERSLRNAGRDAARVVDVIMMLMAALGFEGNHYRLINSLMAFAKKLPNPFVYFVATHAQIYQKYRRAKTIKERSTTALVGADTAKLRAEQDALGYEVIGYIPGKMNLETNQGYGSRYRLQILRFALIAINLADNVKDEFERRWQADEWAALEVAKMIPRRDPGAKVASGSKKAEARTKSESDFEVAKKEFLKALAAELNRIVEREVAKPGTIDSLSDCVDEVARDLSGKTNRLASEALCRGLAELAAIESESQAENGQSRVAETLPLQFDENKDDAAQNDAPYIQQNMDIRFSENQPSDSAPLVQQNMDIGPPPFEADVNREHEYLLRNRKLIQSMPGDGRAGPDPGESLALEPEGRRVWRG